MPTDLRKALEKLRPQLLEAHRAGLSEADTVQRVARLFEDVLGYDPLQELTRDKAVGSCVDLAVKLGDDVPLLVEVVAAGTPLVVEHVAEARRVAARDNVSFILLTNGVVFNLYHVSLDEDLEIALVFSVDLRADVSEETVEMLGLLQRRAVSKGKLAGYWEQRSRLGPAVLGRLLLGEDVLGLLRRRLRRDHGIRIDSALLAASVHELLAPAVQRCLGPVGTPGARDVDDAVARSAPHVVDAPDDAPHIVDPSDGA